MKKATTTMFDGGHAAFLEDQAAFIAGFAAFTGTLGALPAEAVAA